MAAKNQYFAPYAEGGKLNAINLSSSDAFGAETFNAVFGGGSEAKLGLSRLNLAVVAVAAIYLISILTSYLKLRHIPGPTAASISNIPRFLWAFGRRNHLIQIGLHEKYGQLVRMGPNAVSVADPKEIAQIYGFTGKFAKSDFYSVILPMSKGKLLPGMFATQDEKLHTILKKPIAGVYSMSNLVSFEPYVDSTIQTFIEQLDQRFVAKNEICDFSTWLQYFAFDVVGEITFSKRLGFLETGHDVENIMGSIWNFFQYVGIIGTMPWIEKLWVKNPIVSRLRPAGWNAMAAFAMARIKEREAMIANGDDDSHLNNRDFLSRFMEARVKDPSIPEWAVLAWAQSNVTAGSDTTAIFLRTLFYMLLKHPETLAKLHAELNEAREKGELNDVAGWHQTRSLQYLDACIKESGRIHHPFGMSLERIVPSGGATISGTPVPEGTIVGINGWVIHRNKEIFGDDVEAWRPERWLCEDIEQRKNMDRHLFTFGAGHRSCIGKNISQLEIYKLVPTLLQRYDITLANPEREWRTENRWFVPQFDFDVKLSLKEQ